jgi:hypothetical protein
MGNKQVSETLEQTDLRLRQVLPYTWDVLLQTPFPDDIWKKVNASNSGTVGPLVDVLENATKALATKLRISPKQAALILIETCFTRLE